MRMLRGLAALTLALPVLSGCIMARPLASSDERIWLSPPAGYERCARLDLDFICFNYEERLQTGPRPP